MSSIDKTFAKAINNRFAKKQNDLQRWAAEMGDGIGNLLVDGQDGFVYVTIDGIASPVFNNRVAPKKGVKVWVGYSPEQPTLFQVLSTRSETPAAGVEGVTGYAPARRYEYNADNGGEDPVYIELRAFLPLRVGISVPGGLIVELFRGFVFNGTNRLHVDTQNINLSSYVPSTANKMLFALITINSTGSVVVTVGAEVNINTRVYTDIPAAPTGTIFESAAIRLYQGQTVIQEARTNSDIVDLRFSGRATPGSLPTLTPARVVVTNISTGIAETTADLEYNSSNLELLIGKALDTLNSLPSFRWVHNTAVATQYQLYSWGSSLANQIKGHFANGSRLAPTVAVQDNKLLRILGAGYDGTALDNTVSSSEIAFVADETYSSIAHGGRIEIFTTPNGAVIKTLAGTFEQDGSLTMEGHAIHGVLDPLSAQDAATKSYVDAQINNFDIKLAVRAATQGNLAFTRSGNIYTATAVGVLLKATIDSGWASGATLAVGDRILLANQTAPADNGIVTITNLGTVGTNAVLTRSTDADVSAEVLSEMRVPVSEGTDANLDYKLSAPGPFTLNTTALPFTKAGGPPTGAAGGELAGTYPNPTVTNASVIAKLLTAFSAGAGTVSSSDSILGAFQKVVGNIALKLTANSPITGATKTKITYDANGLVTAGADIAAGDLPTGIDATKIGAGTVSNTEFGYVDGVTSAIQTQINGKQVSLGYTAENTANKDASGGYVGLSAWKINFRNAANTFTPFLVNAATGARTYTFPDKDGIVAMISDVREVLIATRTYYVRTDGSDGNNGLSNTAGGAFLTIQKAVDIVAGLDRSIYAVTIQVAAGTYTGAILIQGWGPGSGSVSLIGDTTTPSNVLISVAGNAIPVTNYTVLTLGGFKITTSAGSKGGLTVEDFATVNITGKMVYGACNTCHLFANHFANINISADYTINGNAVIGWAVQENSRLSHITTGITVTLSGTPAFTITARSQYLSYLNFHNTAVTFSGAATGKRYVSEQNGVIETGGSGANFIPGNAAGTTATGGQYI